jgi:hypothetical protein
MSVFFLASLESFRYKHRNILCEHRCCAAQPDAMAGAGKIETIEGAKQ